MPYRRHRVKPRYLRVRAWEEGAALGKGRGSHVGAPGQMVYCGLSAPACEIYGPALRRKAVQARQPRAPAQARVRVHAHVKRQMVHAVRAQVRSVMPSHASR